MKRRIKLTTWRLCRDSAIARLMPRWSWCPGGDLAVRFVALRVGRREFILYF